MKTQSISFRKTENRVSEALQKSDWFSRSLYNLMEDDVLPIVLVLCKSFYVSK